jgi:uncharacterized protein (DUF362 family)
MVARVAIVRGEDRYRNVLSALRLIEGDVRLGDRIVVKPNLVSITNQLAATHADALRAVLQFIRERSDRDIVIAEGSASSDTVKGFERYGYRELAARFGARLVDLNRDRSVEVGLVDRDARLMKVRIARTIAESDCRISLAPMKTHDTVVVTLSLKNLVMGSLIREHRDMGPALERLLHGLGHWIRPRDPLFPSAFTWVVRKVIRSDKMMIHQTYAAANYNLYLLARAIPAHLAVLDGFVAMEGAGPTHGSPVELRLAMASTDFVACDCTAARIMGVDPWAVGYLSHAVTGGLGQGDAERIEVLGERVEACLRPFRLHPGHSRQLGWRTGRQFAPETSGGMRGAPAPRGG